MGDGMLVTLHDPAEPPFEVGRYVPTCLYLEPTCGGANRALFTPHLAETRSWPQLGTRVHAADGRGARRTSMLLRRTTASLQRSNKKTLLMRRFGAPRRSARDGVERPPPLPQLAARRAAEAAHGLANRAA
jgi:hypothetical protein